MYFPLSIILSFITDRVIRLLDVWLGLDFIKNSDRLIKPDFS